MANPTAGGNWAAKYTAVPLPPGPFGWFDGLNGSVTRKLALGTANGLSISGGVMVSGCPSSCTVTITTTYEHGMAVGDSFSIHGTRSETVNTAATGNAHAPFTVASVTPTSFTSASFQADLANGDYTFNNTCGPATPPNDTNIGTNNCVRISQLAYTGNVIWDRLMSDTKGLYGPANPGKYLFPQDNPTGGYFLNGPVYGVSNVYSLAAIRWFVDPSDTLSFRVALYFMKNVEQSFGVSWPCYADIVFQACGVTSGGLQGDQDQFWAGLSFLAAIIVPSMSPATRQTFIDKMYNDTNDYHSTITTAHTDMSEDRLNRVIATGQAQGGSATSIKLAASDTQPSGYYVGSVVHLGYSTPITNWAIGNGTVVTTAGNWGYNANIPIINNTIFVKISGVSGAGCESMNNWWQISSSGGLPIDNTHFQIQNLPGCSQPVGGTVTSYDLQCPDASIGIYHPCAGLITAYDADSKIATISGGFGGTAPLNVTPDMAYKVYATISLSTNAANASATVIGYNTHFTTDIAVGDAIVGANGYTSTFGYPWLVMSYVTSVIDDTHLTVLNENNPIASGKPTIAWFIPAWKPGDTGFKWYGDHWQGAVGTQAVKAPPSGGGLTGCPSGVCPGANNGILYSHARAGLALNLAPYDSRAVKDLAMMWSYALDYELSHYLAYISGQAHSGSVYSLGNEYAIGFMATTLFPGIPDFPAIDNQWAKNTALYGIYSILPDLNWNSLPPKPTPMAYGGESGQGYIDPGSATEQAYGLNPVFSLAPTSDEAKYLAYFINQYGMSWGYITGRLNYDGIALLHDDPRTFARAKPYNGLPLQYGFLKSGSSVCAASAGSTNTGNQLCPGGLKSFSMISRTGWSDPITLAGRTSTLTYFGMRSYAGDHDTPQCGATWIYKVGQLIGLDGTGTIGYGNEDGTIRQDLLRFGNTSLNRNFGYASPSIDGRIPYGYCSTTQWASSNHGSWDPQYGDQDSKYAYACADITSTYHPGTLNWGRRCVADLKDTSLNGGTGEQIIVQGTFVDTSSAPIAVEGHIHYSQNGQSLDGSESVGMTYSEGNTTCPGSDGCRNLDATRLVQSMEDGGTDVVNPKRQYGVLTRIFSPGAITVRDDSFVVNITGVTPGNPTIFTAPANGVKTAYPIASIKSVAGNPAFTDVVTSVPNDFQLGYAPLTIRGVSSTGGSCNAINGLTPSISSVTDNTHFRIVFDSSRCVGTSGGLAFDYPEANVKILGATGRWAALNSNYSNGPSTAGLQQTCSACMASPAAVLPMTYIDQDHFSVPVDTTGFAPEAWNGTVYAAYPGAYGYSHRISLCGGSQCGLPVSSYETVVVHKIAQDLSDTTITAVQLNVDANWIGIQTRDKVILMSRGKSPQTTIGTFTTTHAGTAQYLFGNVAAGTWDVRINGAPVAGSPFSVQNGDNSIHFESVAGSVSAFGVLQACQSTNTAPLPVAVAGVPYFYTIRSSNCTPPLSWSLWSGSAPLCDGLSVDAATGVISGIPKMAEICNFTVQVQDATMPVPATATETLQITATDSPALSVTPLSLGFYCATGGANPPGQNVFVGAGGVALNHWAANKNQPWLSVSPGTANAAGSMSVNVSCAGLAPGSYSDKLSITSTTTGITNNPRTVAISLVVSPPPPVPSLRMNGVRP